MAKLLRHQHFFSPSVLCPLFPLDPHMSVVNATLNAMWKSTSVWHFQKVIPYSFARPSLVWVFRGLNEVQLCMQCRFQGWTFQDASFLARFTTHTGAFERHVWFSPASSFKPMSFVELVFVQAACKYLSFYCAGTRNNCFSFLLLPLLFFSPLSFFTDALLCLLYWKSLCWVFSLLRSTFPPRLVRNIVFLRMHGFVDTIHMCVFFECTYKEIRNFVA